MLTVIVFDQVDRNKVEFTSYPAVERAEKKEVSNAWKNAYVEIHEDWYLVLCKEKVLDLILFIMSLNLKASWKKLNAGLLRPGHGDHERNCIKNDSYGLLSVLIRLLLRLETYLGFPLDIINSTTIHLQSGSFTCTIYIRPVMRVGKSGMLQKLTEMSYRVSAVGHQLAKGFEGWALSSIDFKHVPDGSQPYNLWESQGSVKALPARITDNYLISGSKDVM